MEVSFTVVMLQLTLGLLRLVQIVQILGLVKSQIIAEDQLKTMEVIVMMEFSMVAVIILR